MAKYRVLSGINYPDGKGGEKRAEPGDVVDDLSTSAVKALVEIGAIEPVEAKAKTPKKAEPEPDVAAAPETEEG